MQLQGCELSLSSICGVLPSKRRLQTSKMQMPAHDGVLIAILLLVFTFSKPITPRPLSLWQTNDSPPFAYKSPPQPFAPGLLQRCSLLFPPMRRWVSNLAAGFGSPFHLLEKSSLKTVSCVHCSTFSIGQKSGRSWEIIFSYYLIPFLP